MKKSIIFAILISLSGCTAMSALDAVNPLKEDKGISATVQLGKENHSDTSKQLIKAGVTDSSTETNTVSGNQTINETKNTNIPWWTAFLLLFVRPMVILRDTINLFRSKDTK